MQPIDFSKKSSKQISQDGSMYISRGHSLYIVLKCSSISFPERSFLSEQTVHTLMKYRFRRHFIWGFTVSKCACRYPEKKLTLKAPIATNVVCFSRLLICLRSLYGKQCVPRSDCSYRSSLFWVNAVCFYT